MADDERWVTITEATKLLGKSDRTIRRYEAKGELPSVRRAGRVYVNVAGLPIIEPEPEPEPEPDLQALQVEVERLRAVLEQVKSERDYLRQLLAVSLAENKQLEPGRRQWWQFWKNE